MASYNEIIIKGDSDVVDAYLRGFLAGRGIKSGFFFSREWPFHLEKIRERIKYRGGVEHVVCLSKLKQTIVGSIENSSVDIEVKAARKIKSCSFHFDFRTANRQTAGAIKRTLRNLPDGVDLEDFDPAETVHPSGKGVEVYTPLHEYEFRGKGLIRGDVDGVLKVHKRMRENEVYRTEDIDIHA